jgi:hypothetical protein
MLHFISGQEHLRQNELWEQQQKEDRAADAEGRYEILVSYIM